jgi:hypothetical protein
VFVPQSGSVTSIYTAIDPTNPEAAIPLPPGSLTPYPNSFAIPAGHPYAYLGDGFSRGKAKDKKPNLANCVVTDVGKTDDGFENFYTAGDSEASVTDCLVDGVEQDLCFVEGVTYHYTDIYTVKAVVSGNRGTGVQAAGADDAGSADRRHKHKNSGQRGR